MIIWESGGTTIKQKGIKVRIETTDFKDEDSKFQAEKNIKNVLNPVLLPSGREAHIHCESKTIIGIPAPLLYSIHICNIGETPPADWWNLLPPFEMK
jgi:hypothetical protein